MLLRFIYAALVLLSAFHSCAPLSLNLLRPLTARFSATANSIDRDLQPAEVSGECSSFCSRLAFDSYGHRCADHTFTTLQ